jgi:RNA polymerase sigma-70 factor, ECF subfamily
MDTTEADLLDRADMEKLAAGNSVAFDDLMGRHARPIFRFLYRMLGNEDDADDLAQETFVRVYQHSSSFKSDARFTTWLYTIAANLARNHHRWRTRHPNVSLDAENEDTQRGLQDTLSSSDPTPNEAALAAERTAAVRAAVERLPEDLREAVILCEWEDLAVVEAATVLNTTPKAIESRLYRARKVLREMLKQWL